MKNLSIEEVEYKYVSVETDISFLIDRLVEESMLKT